MTTRHFKQRLAFAYLVIAIIMIIFSPAISHAQADKVFRENNKAVVVVIAYDDKGKAISQGSGYIVREDGAIVTNYHVVSNAIDIKVKAGEKILETEGLLHVDKENDLVLLKVKGERLQTVKIGDIEKLNIGEKVYVISSPEGLENTISDGILSGIRKLDPQRKILQITASVSQGSSGGPVFNINGEVIGTATFLVEGAQNLNFAMPINVIGDKISEKKIIKLKDAEIEDYKKTAEYWFYLGFYLEGTSLQKDAMEAYKQAIRIKPGLAEAHYNLGVTYYRLGMHREALEVFKQLIRIEPGWAEAHDNLGITYDKLGMNREATEAYKQAIRMKPDLAEAHFNLGIAYFKLGMHREAIEAYKQAIRIKPDYAEAHENLGVTYAELGMYREAIEAYKQAIIIKPDDALANYNLGVTYAELGMRREALEAYKQAIRIKPDYEEAHAGLGISYGKLGMYREAVEAFQQAIRIDPNDAKAHYNLGITYLGLRDNGSALDEYKVLKGLDTELANKLFNLIYK